MSTQYVLKSHPFAINRGKDNEFEVVADVSFSVTPREAATSTYPGCEPAIEDVAVTLSQSSRDQLLYPCAEAVAVVEAMIEDELSDDPVDLWDHVSRQRERELL